MVARINLLGSPSVERAGTVVAPPRGSKAWALLAYLALTDGPVPRSRLMELLFDAADDPAAALRWSLSQLRRALADVADVSGDPLRLVPHPGTVTDVDVVARGSWVEALLLPGFGGALLEGVSPRVGPVFDLWLSTERRRTSGQTAAMLQEAAHSRLARGDVASAVDLASRLVLADPLTERSHELLVRALVAGGDREAAVGRVAQCRELFLRELGTAPSAALDAAVRFRPVAGTMRSVAQVDAAIEGAVAAAHVGAYEHAIELLRSAVDGSRALDDAAERARSADDQRALAYALTATGRLRLLRGEVELARVALDLACSTADELGWTSFLPFPRALRAEVTMALGDLEGAAAAFDRSYALACQVGDPCWESYSLRGRGLLAATLGDDAVALDLLVEASAACRRQRVTHNWVEGHCLDAVCGFAVDRGLVGAAAWVDELEDFASRRGMRELVARAALHCAALDQVGARELATVLLESIDNPAL